MLRHIVSVCCFVTIMCLNISSLGISISRFTSEQDAYKMLSELEKISEIQVKIISIKKKINHQLAYMIAESIYKNCKKTNKDPDMIIAIMAIESHFNPMAKSPTGARGLMQVMPFWAKEFNVSIDDLYDIDINIKSGIKILTSYEKLYTKYDLVLTTYNRGPIAVQHSIREGKNPRTGYSKNIINLYKKIKDVGSSTYIAAR